MIDAVASRDKEAARVWTRRHLVDWRKGFERAGRDIDEPVERIFEPPVHGQAVLVRT